MDFNVKGDLVLEKESPQLSYTAGQHTYAFANGEERIDGHISRLLVSVIGGEAVARLVEHRMTAGNPRHLSSQLSPSDSVQPSPARRRHLVTTASGRTARPNASTPSCGFPGVATGA